MFIHVEAGVGGEVIDCGEDGEEGGVVGEAERDIVDERVGEDAWCLGKFGQERVHAYEEEQAAEGAALAYPFEEAEERVLVERELG